MESPEIWPTIHAQRARLVDLLATLDADDWNARSLCAGWRVRDVAAHVIMSAATSTPAMLVEMVRDRGNFNRMIDRTARRGGAREPGLILADFRAHATSRRRPPGTSPLDPLMDVLIHSQDIAIPLGRDLPMPIDAGTAVAGHLYTQGFPFHAARRFAGLQFIATDTDLTLGTGRPVHGPVAAIALTLTGRTALVDELTGPGLDHPALSGVGGST